jgi:hypothetical protein
MAMERFAGEVVSLIKTATDALSGRLDLLEKRVASVRDGIDGKDGAPGKDGRDGMDGAKGLDGVDGQTGPAGADGRDGKDGADGIDGKDAPPVTREQIMEALAAYLAANPIPSPKDGVDGKDGAKGADGRDGKDGVGLAGVFQSAEGSLVLTLSNGEAKDIGRVKGADGAPGRDGKDGADGLGFDDLVVEHDGERTFTIKMVRGDRVKELGTFKMPAQIYRGVYDSGKAYDVGDTVTRSGAQWVCLAPAQDNLPGSPDGAAHWQLSVKAGRDGKEGKQGVKGDPGPRGEKGDDGRRYS